MTIRLLLLAFILPILSHAEDYDRQKTEELYAYINYLNEKEGLEWSSEVANDLRTLVDAGADPNVKTKSKMGAADFAAWYGDIELVGHFLDKGADIRFVPFISLFNTGSQQGLIELMTLCSKKRHVMKAIGEKVLALLFRLQWQDEFAALVTDMVSNGADINGVSSEISWCPNGKSISIQNPLMCASKDGNLEAMGLLLNLGANIDLTDETEMTALHHATRANQVAASVLLLARGARMNLDPIGWRADHLPQATRKLWSSCEACKDQNERNFVLESFRTDS